MAHAGAIKALEEHGIFPEVISGASAGALVGALYARGLNPEEMLDFFREIKIFSISHYARKKPGFVDTDKFHQFLEPYFPQNSFEDLNKKLFVTATDIVNARVSIFSQGDLIKPLLASSAFPGIFTPVALGDSLYADGGILDNFPVGPIKPFADEIFGIYVSPIKKMKVTDFKHSYEVLDRAFHLRMHQHSVAKFHLCDVVVYPYELSDHSIFSSKHLDEMFDIGYRRTLQELQRREAQNRFIELKS